MDEVRILMDSSGMLYRLVNAELECVARMTREEMFSHASDTQEFRTEPVADIDRWISWDSAQSALN
ncbi:MAG TPA: hypothetical protein VFN73_07420 [Propionibacteriaceae bacterium]|nr:hypothetical protein [Propionibacteriaceae bacterium]